MGEEKRVLQQPKRLGENKIREQWVKNLSEIMDPILTNLAQNTLKQEMPLYQHAQAADREYCTYLEALARVLAGACGWFSIEAEDPEEEKKRQHYLSLAHRAIAHAVDERAKDFVFTPKEGQLLHQILVDAAFLAYAFLGALETLWEPLEEATKQNVIHYLKATRSILPYHCNWILFSSIIETFFAKVGQSYDVMRIDYGIRQLDEWYVGDGIYKDGPLYHQDYYNSYVIHPFLLEILENSSLENSSEVYPEYERFYPKMKQRAIRYSAILERQIGVDGSFPLVGRSLTYRMGAFHHLARMAWKDALPEGMPPQQVRRALTKVIHKSLAPKGTFDEKGFLQIGVYGKQPSLGEAYISTGSLYLCTTAFLPLGLPASHDFWSKEEALITMEQILTGQEALIDGAIHQ